jgi:DNA repair exonuclease SbcCD ATPase subunit
VSRKDDDMKILNLTLQNFMGIRDLELNLNKQDSNIYGANAAGKTTCFSAFMWLLFNKDSDNKSDFEIKTLGPDGEPEHGIEHSAEAILELEDGNQIALKKVYQEKWVKKRGSATAEFTGHTTDHFIDGVPVQKKEYDARIAEIADEQIFRLLTDPRYFNEQLHWQRRRDMLLEVCGDVTDEEVISSKKDLAKLADILGSRSIEQHRKVIQARRTEINRELEKIPVRIDEADMGKPEPADFESAERELDKLYGEQSELREQIATIKAGGGTAKKQEELSNIKSEIVDLKNSLEDKKQEALKDMIQQEKEARDTIEELASSLESTENRILTEKRHLNGLEQEIKGYRENWHKINKREFEFEQDKNCPTCGQPLPEDKLKAAREKAQADFNRDKSEQLEAVSQKGKDAKKEYDQLRFKLGNMKAEQDKTKASIAKLETALQGYLKKIKAESDKFEDVEDLPEYKEKVAAKDKLQKEIQKIRDSKASEIQALEGELQELNGKIKALQSELAKREQIEKAEARIKELKAEERKLAAEYEELEHQVHLTEEFIRTKVHLLEKKINSKFKMARFKLFNTLVNGGVEECCETMYEGVPYTGNLNNGAKVQVGLDIIRTLAEHFNFAPPVWLDNAESVTDILPTKGQQIRLIVSGKDKKLRIELAEREEFKEAV